MSNMYRLLKSPFFKKYMGKWQSQLANSEHTAWCRFHAQSESGARLTGLYYRARHAKANIVLGHPMGREAKGFFIARGYADFLIDNGYNVFVFDFNGFGESETGNFDYPLDVLAVGKMVKAMMPELPVGYLGVSMGASWGICALSRKGHVFDAAVFDSPFTTVDEFWKKSKWAYLAVKVLGTFMPSRKRQLNTINQVTGLKRIQSAAFICCLEDETTPLSMTLQLRERANVSSELLVVNYHRHAMGFLADARQYTDYVIRHFNAKFSKAVVPEWSAGKKFFRMFE